MSIKISLDQYQEFTDNYIGLCVKCGTEKSGCEPDAENYTCDECGERTVFGPMYLLLNDMIGQTNPRFEELRELHKEYWTWCSLHPERSEKEWPRWKSNGGDVSTPLDDCFACEACEGKCENCPISWGASEGCYESPCCSVGSPYLAWLTSARKRNAIRARKEAAKAFADLPWTDRN